MIRIDSPATITDIIEDIEQYNVWNYLNNVWFRHRNFHKALTVISENCNNDVYFYSIRTKRGKFFI